ncbi:MAG TPA: peptide deformylase [Phycisphaerales bacterium]|nr:peptide deformylase [Phycisphaerales bacterium]HMP38138.1 peptide deformylase [Phycisphaerales bacterium]
MSVDPSKLRILAYPAEALRRTAAPVAAIDETVRRVAERMIELMHEADGVGLAAPQVGLPWRLFVTGGAPVGGEDLVYINPRFVRLEGELVASEEGCLSLPGIRAEIRRPPSATITATDPAGQSFTRSDDGFLARVWQHEQDHLDGVLILDRMTPIDRIATRRAVRKLVLAAEE